MCGLLRNRMPDVMLQMPQDMKCKNLAQQLCYRASHPSGYSAYTAIHMHIEPRTYLGGYGAEFQSHQCRKKER